MQICLDWRALAHVRRVRVLCHFDVYPVLSHRGGGDGGDCPPEEDQKHKIFLNVSENKYSNRKLSNSVRFVRLLCRITISKTYEDISTPYIGTGINGIPLKHPWRLG